MHLTCPVSVHETSPSGEHKVNTKTCLIKIRLLLCHLHDLVEQAANFKVIYTDTSSIQAAWQLKYKQEYHCTMPQWRSQEFATGCIRSFLPFPPLPLPFPFPSPSLLPSPSSFPLEGGSLNTARGSGERCKLPQWGPSQNRFWCILALKSDVWWHQFY